MADELDEVLQLAFQQMQTMSKELRVSQSGERALLNIITTETSRRRSAERRVEVLESLLASEIEAREASDSARQMAVDRANAYEVQRTGAGERERKLQFEARERSKGEGARRAAISRHFDGDGRTAGAGGRSEATGRGRSRCRYSGDIGCRLPESLSTEDPAVALPKEGGVGACETGVSTD